MTVCGDHTLYSLCTGISLCAVVARVLVFGRAWMFVYYTQCGWLRFFSFSLFVFSCERYTQTGSPWTWPRIERIRIHWQAGQRNACDFKRMWFCFVRFACFFCSFSCEFFRFYVDFWTALSFFSLIAIFYIFTLSFAIIFVRRGLLSVCVRLLFEPFHFSYFVFAFHSLFFAHIWIGNFFLFFCPSTGSHKFMQSIVDCVEEHVCCVKRNFIFLFVRRSTTVIILNCLERRHRKEFLVSVEIEHWQPTFYGIGIGKGIKNYFTTFSLFSKHLMVYE